MKPMNSNDSRVSTDPHTVQGTFCSLDGSSQ
jgi:hypothetical protein